MIDVDLLYNRVNADLALKDQTGFSTNDQFNRSMQDAQDILFTYWINQFPLNQLSIDALSPFSKEADLQIDEGYVSRPNDYRHKIDMLYVLTTNSIGSAEPVVDYLPMREAQPDEEYGMLGSALRKPTITKKNFKYTQEGIRFKVMPYNLTGQVKLKYFRNPVDPVRVVTIDQVNVLENYDAANSTQLEWPEQELPNLVDLMLLEKGIQVRDSELIQWVQAQNAITQQLPVNQNPR